MKYRYILMLSLMKNVVHIEVHFKRNIERNENSFDRIKVIEFVKNIPSTKLSYHIKKTKKN